MTNQSSTGSATAATGRRFYGWTAFSAAAIAGLLSNGIFIFAYGVFLPVMTAEFGWSRASIALGMTLGYVFFGIVSPLVGISVARFGSRINMFAGNLLLALCLAGMSQVNELWQVFVLYSLAGVASNFASAISTSAVASNWFIKKRSLAMGIISGSIGVGGFIVPLIATKSIAAIGWRMSWLALIGLVVIGLICLIFVRNKPEDMGQMPDGVRGEEARAQAKGMRAQSATAWTVKSVLRQPSTWLIMVFMTSNFFAWAAMMAHQVAYVTEELGATPMVGAMTMSVVPGASILGGLLFGVLALKFGAKRLAIVSFALYTLALVILLVTKSVPFVFTYAFLFGLSGGAILPVMSTLLADYYGRAIFPKVLGLMNFFIFPFRAAAPTITGAIFDAAGNYALAFIIMAAFSFVGFILSILVSRPKPPELIEKTIARPV